MAELVAIDLPGGPAFVDAVRRIWDRGDAVLPLDQRLPQAAQQRVLETLRPTLVLDAHGERSLDGTKVEPGDALVVPTSGSTGTPKGVVHTHAGLVASAHAGNARLGTTTDDHWLACLPLAHIGGFTVITKAVFAGAGLTVLPRFDTDAVVAAAGHGVTMVSLVPTALRRIDPAAFRIVLLGGSRPPTERPANVIATYGSTETGSGIVYDGHPLDGVEIRIADDGEILVRGPMLMRGYRDGTTVIDADGWLHTDDLGAWTVEGQLRVEGRRGDMIVSGGENIWPDAVERVLATDPDVADVAVAGVADPEWGQRVTAWVVPARTERPPSVEQLRALVADQLAPYMAPKRIHVVADLPRTPLGKVVRSALVEPPAD